MSTIIPSEVGVQRVVAVFLRAHLRLVAKGMKPRGRKRDLLRKAGMITGVTYKRGEYAKAVDDLTAYLEKSRE